MGNKYLGIIHLSAGTSALNFSAYLVASLFTISLFVFFNSSQTFVLSLVLKVPSSDLGKVNGLLVFWDQLLSIALLGTWGALSDRLGRRVIFVIGFAVMGASMLGFSFASNVLPQLLLLRMLFGVGAAASSGMVTAVLSDYVRERDKGKVSGLVGLTSGLGALVGVFVLFALPSYLNGYFEDLVESLHVAYWAIGAMSLAISVFLMVALRAPEGGDVFSRSYWRRRRTSSSPVALTVDGGNGYQAVGVSSAKDIVKSPSSSFEDFTDDNSHPVSSCPFSGASRTHLASDDEHMGCTMPGVVEQVEITDYRSFWSLILAGFQLGLRKPSLLLAYLGGFIARGDSIIITLFLPLWINKYYLDNELCTPGAVSTEGFEDPLKVCDEAFKKAYMYSGIAQTFALIGAPLFGIISDRFSRSWTFIIAALLSFAGYFPLVFIKDPVNDKSMYLFMVVLGLGEIGMIVTSLALATSGVPKEVRGSVAGCYSLFGGLGILILTSLGGILADRWVTGPFFVVGILSLLVAGGGLMIQVFSSRSQGAIVLSPPAEDTAPSSPIYQ